MQLVTALLFVLITIVGGAFVLPVWPDAMSKLGLVEQSELIEPPKPKPSAGPAPQQSELSELRPRSFDIAKIATDGTSVFAGKSTPNAAVSVFADGEIVGTAKTDGNGEWVLVVDRKFANPDPKLSVQVGPVQMAAQSIPSPRADGPLAAPSSSSASSSSARLIDELEKKVEQARAEADRVASAQSGTPTDTTPYKTATDTFQLATAAPATDSTAVSPDIVPVPIKFVFRTAEFTPEGKKAADLLLQHLQLRKLPSIRMTGHADERGTHKFNMNLSSDRLEAVAAFLRAGGYTGRVDLIPKGDLEPYSGVDRSVVPREQLYDLDRRVELRVAE